VVTVAAGQRDDGRPMGICRACGCPVVLEGRTAALGAGWVACTLCGYRYGDPRAPEAELAAAALRHAPLCPGRGGPGGPSRVAGPGSRALAPPRADRG